MMFFVTQRLILPLIGIAGLLAVLAYPRLVSAEELPERFETTSYKDVEDLFERLGFTPEAWQAGVRVIPRVYLAHVPSRWRRTHSKEVSVRTKKRLFFRVLAPLVLRVNELILDDRARVQSLAAELAEGRTLGASDIAWLDELAEYYKVTPPDSTGWSAHGLATLLLRVDIIPASLALSQAAQESGWGTSRFADLGNAVFGQWTRGAGITPDRQREKHSTYRIAAFESLIDSVHSYARNLNSNRAYRVFRRSRAVLRARGERVSGYRLVQTLNRYSEEGQRYVDSLRQIMRVNRLDAVDDAYLDHNRPILIVPVGVGSE